MNRREILRTGSLSTLGILAAQSFQTALGQARVAGSNDRIRIGIVGFSDRLKSALLPAYKAVAAEFNCEIVGVSDITAANTGADGLTTAHMKNWLECLRSRKQPNASVEAGYQHSIATIMANAAARTGERVTFDEKTQEVMAGGTVFHL